MKSYKYLSLTIVLCILFYFLILITPDGVMATILSMERHDAHHWGIMLYEKVLFYYVFPLMILFSSFLEIRFNNESGTFSKRLMKIFLTIICVYLFCWILYILLGNKTVSMFHHPRGLPVLAFVFVTIGVSFGGLILLELLKRSPAERRS